MLLDLRSCFTNTIFYVLACLLSILFLTQTSALGADTKALQGDTPPEGAMWTDTLDMSGMFQSWGSPKAAKSVEGRPITLKGNVFQHGIGTHARSEYVIDLKKAAAKFEAVVGVDDESGAQGSVVFQVWLDGKKKADSGVLKGGDEPKLLSVDVSGAQYMTLIVTEADGDINWDHADWAGAVFYLTPGTAERPQPATVADQPVMPIASGVSAKPAIHGPRIVGTTPGRPLIFLVPATGEGPLMYSAGNLPQGLSLDPKTGIISGSLKEAGEYIVSLSVSGAQGKAERKLKIVVGNDKLALTPPMGWNSWNVWAGAIDDQKVRQAADWMVKSGLAAHGFQYINIDDCWEAGRDNNGEILCNGKFPDMKALADYVHSKGLKIGIYSSPGPKTCGGFEGSYQHEELDAKTYAKWGIDYLKYDWCSYSQVAKDSSLPEMQKPYRVMRQALDKCERDIVYSFCQYGMANVWEWGEELGGNLWRTTGDITDTWLSMSNIGFDQDGHEKYAGPGHWNDPDMLVVGKVGWGPNLHPTRLAPNEQITHITLWSLLAAPLLIGCDLSDMDQFTIDLLTNDEVLDVNQDPLGKAAGRRYKEDHMEVWARPLWDGTMAVGLFNRGFTKAKVTAKWPDLGLAGSQPVRDLWQKKDLGTFNGSFSADIPGHGAVLVKVGKANRTDW